MIEKNLYAERVYRRCSKDTVQLENNANKYPFSSLAGFLLLYHYKKTENPLFETFAKKTAVSFSNTYWLQLLLHEENNSVQEKKDIPVNETPAEIAVAPNFYEEKKENFTGKPLYKNNDLLPESFAGTTSGNDIKKSVVQESAVDTFHENEDHDNNNEEVNETEIPMQIVLPQMNNIKVSDDAIAFDPLHTVDYFASQGIRLNEEELTSNDKLGSQMKSFTAWLKSMKKLHPGKLGEQGIASEKLVQTSAEESNVNTDVLTEAMAEVLIKQDKKDKAIDMYHKLSLINPSKSAYFAAKIESIKQR